MHSELATLVTDPNEAPHTPWGSEPEPRVGKYEIVSLLGKGAMGAVYRAHDPILDRDVALKVMLPQIANDPEQKQRFEREARAVARMMHPNVVMVFDLGYHTDGSPYIVMELLRGRDLLHSLREGPPMSLGNKLAIVLQVLEGLGHAHKVGIVHRDIKPANVFVTEDGTTKIMDFGVARLGATSATAAGVVFGTANYMSPEQVVGGPLDGRSDLFSVGCMLTELLTNGHRPFDANSLMTTLFKIVNKPPVITLPGTPEYEGLIPILERSLAKSVEDRYPTSAEFANALRGFLERSFSHGGAPPLRILRPGSADPTPTPDPTRDLRMVGGSPPPAIPVPSLRADPTGLFRLLRTAYVGSKSGHLHCTDGGARRSLSILKGRIIHGTSDASGEHLGDVMVRYGLLSQWDLERAIALVLADRKRLGTVLSELGLASPDRLQEGVGLHVREILFSALERPGSTFVLEEMAESFLATELTSDLSTGEVILEATRRVQDPDLVRRVLGNTDRVLVLSSDPLLRSQTITLTPLDGFVLSRIDGTLTAREILSLIPHPHEDTERSLFGLLSTGTVDYRDRVRTRPGPAVATRPRVPAPPVPPPPPVAPPAPQPPSTGAPPAPQPPSTGAPADPPRAASPSPDELRRIILDAHEGLRRNHFAVLGISREATEAEVKKAYRECARLLHPDACHDANLTDLDEKREAVFIRVCEAYEVLRDPTARSKYESTLRIPVRRPESPPRKADAPPAVAPPPSPATPQIAGTTESAETDGPSPESIDGARLVRAAELLLKEQKYWDAIQALEKAIPQLQGVLRHRALVALARAFMKNPKWLKRAEDVLHRVVGENPRFTEAYVALGSVYAAGQLVNRASGMYRKALELDPGHPQAREGLETLEKATQPSQLMRLFRKN